VRRLVFAVVAGVLCVVLCSLVMAARARAQRSPRFVTVEVSRSDIRVTVNATGTLQAVSTTEVGTEVTGKVTFLGGVVHDRVKKGQVLATIDPQQLRAATDQAAAQVNVALAAVVQARATVAQAEDALKRARDQEKLGLLSKQDLATAIANADRARAGVDSASATQALAQAQSSQARTQLSKTTIVAPTDGVVLARYVELGQTLTAGFQTPQLFKIAQDLTKMKLNVDIDEADVGRVHASAHASFTVEAYPERSFESTVLRVGNEPTTSSNVVTYQAVLAVDNAEGVLRPGMTCTVTIVADERKDVLSIPNAALRFTPAVAQSGFGPPGPAKPQTAEAVLARGEKRVYVVERERSVARVVRVGASDGVRTEIEPGALELGTKVVVEEEPLRP
jgi:HlyD family secretion protein